MKVFICNDADCKKKDLENTIQELQNKDVTITSTSCMGLCEKGTIVFTLPDMLFYQNVTKERLKDLLNHNAEDLIIDKDIYDSNISQTYIETPIHCRTVKLFRYHLEKFDDFSVSNLNHLIRIFQTKYDIKGEHFFYPIRIALLDTLKGPNLAELIHHLGKETTVGLFDSYFKNTFTKK